MNQFQPQSGNQFIARDASSSAFEWPRRLFLFSLILCTATLAIALSLRFGYSAYLKKAIQEKDIALEALSKQVPAADREGFIAFYSQLFNIRKALAAHRTAGSLFTWLERNIHARVSLQKLDVSFKTNTLTIDGLAASYKDLGEELSALEMMPEVLRYSLDQSQVTDQGVQFKLALVLNQSIFKAP